MHATLPDTRLFLLSKLACPWRSQKGACDSEGHIPRWAFLALTDKSLFLSPPGEGTVEVGHLWDLVAIGMCGATETKALCLSDWALEEPGLLRGPEAHPRHGCHSALTPARPDHGLACPALPWPHLLPPTGRQTPPPQSWGAARGPHTSLGWLKEVGPSEEPRPWAKGIRGSVRDLTKHGVFRVPG